MDDQYDLKGIRFVWDSTKARRNLSKHGIAFEQAAEAFFDPFLKLVDAGPETESRDAIIATNERWQLLFIVHRLLEDDCIRIISARRAS